MKKVVLLVLVLLFSVTGVYATDVSTWITATPSGATSLSTNLSNGISLGYVKVGSGEVGLVSWKPDFKLGPWALGFDFNIPVGSSNPAGIQNVVFRYAQYDDHQKGLRYGVLDNVTLGHGMIMKDYSTRYSYDLILTNNQMGAQAYYNFNKWGLLGMATWHSVFNFGAKQYVNPRLTLTEYVVADSDGVNVLQSDGVTRNFPAQSGFGVDATVPIIGNWDCFAEAGQLNNHGAGVGLGTDWAYDLFGLMQSTFMLTYRVMDKGFVPGYFDVDYESNPVDLSSAEAGSGRNGILGAWAFNVANRLAATLTYEDYNDSNPSLIALANAIVSDKILASGYYKQENFTDLRALSYEQGAILGAAVTYKLNPFSSLTWNYKKAFNSTSGQVEETQYISAGIGF
ncbi:MAG: hypothetical protein WC901_05315 [Candidatus Margulisiibacteriota bacterium]